MRKKTILLCTAFLGLMAGCGSKADSQSSNFLYAAARNIAPAVKTSAAVASGSSGFALASAPGVAAQDMPWYSGNLGGLIFQTLRDYQYPRDEGSIDGTNLYKVLFDAGNIYERNATSLDAITEKAVASPFDFQTFNVHDTYDKGKNGVSGQPVFMATRQVGNQRHLLATMKQGDASMIMQGVHDGDTKDLELNTMMVSPYTSGSMAGEVYGVRSYIKGNETTHSFVFRFLQFSSNPATGLSYYYSVIGMGVSQGADAHFLFYASGPGFSAPETGYYCFAATDAEPQYQAKFAAYPPAAAGGGEPIGADSPCLAYKEGAGGVDAQVAAIPLWGAADGTLDPATFTGSGETHLELGL